MRKITTTITLVMLVLAAGCSSSDSASSTTTTAPTTTAPTTTTTTAAPTTTVPPYEQFLALAKQLNADVVPNRQDAAIRAGLVCKDVATYKDTIGADLDAFPTDLALIRAYCPEVEQQYRA